MITIKELDKERMKSWLRMAENSQKDDPVMSFIAAWIAFNYYYSTFCSSRANRKGFQSWVERTGQDEYSDKTRWLYLMKTDHFLDCYKNLWKSDVLEENIQLPIIDMLYGRKVPDNREGELKWENLTMEEVFRVLYQIRNNLFHGQKQIDDKNERDKKLTTAASNFMVPLLRELISQTQK